MKNYEQKPLGFDRTQLFKEYSQPITNRQSALKAAMTLMTAHNLTWSMSDIMKVVKCIEKWFETGTETWVEGLDTYFKLKEDEKLQELFAEYNKKNIEIL